MSKDVKVELFEKARRMKRACEMSAGIMRDKRRTGGWDGAENTARAFDRLAEDAAEIHSALSTLRAPAGDVREAVARIIAPHVWGEHVDDYALNERHAALVKADAILSLLRQPEQGREGIPDDIAAVVRKVGRAQWGQTDALDAEGHGKHVAESVRLTAAHFDQRDPQHMHGLYIDGTGTVICHTGTSPNSPGIARALTGAWNWLHDQVSSAPVDGDRA